MNTKLNRPTWATCILRSTFAGLLAWAATTNAPTHATTFSWNTSTGTWDNTSLYWAPLFGGPPGSGDHAILGDRVVASDAVVTLGLNTGALDQLDVTGGVDLMTAGFDGEAVDVEISGVGSELVIENGSDFDNAEGGTTVSASGKLVIEDGGFYEGADVTLAGGDVQLTGGLLYIRKNAGAGFLDIESGSELYGWGTVSFRDNGNITGPLFINDGGIRTTRTFPDFGQRLTLTIDVTDSGETSPFVDLDGSSGNGTITLANTTTLEVLGTLTDNYSSTIDMSAGSILDISQPWTLGSGGLVEVDAVQTLPLVAATFARIEGGQLTANGGSVINVNTGRLDIDADFVARAGSQINLANGTTLELGGTATVSDTETIDLTSPNTTLIISGNTTISDASGGFDWDGTGGSADHATTEIRENATLTIDVEQFDNNAEPLKYDGTFLVDGGTLEVHVDNTAGVDRWVMDRTANFNNPGGSVPVLLGSPVDIGNNSGTFDANVNVTGSGNSRIESDVRFFADADVDIAAGATLDLDGDVEWAGGRYEGEGVLDAGRTNAVATDTTIGEAGTNTLTVDLDEGSWIIDDGAKLTLHVAAIDATDVGFDNDITIGDAGRLVVQMPADAPWAFENGDLLYQGNASSETFLAGDPVEFKHQATINVEGSGRIAARVDLGGPVNIIDAGEQLELTGGNLADPNRISGGTIQGNGELALPAGEALAGFGTILADVVGDGELRADDGTLTVTDVDGLAILGTADTDGVLELSLTLNTLIDLSGAMELRGGEVTGAALVANQGLTRGHGIVTVNEFGNAGTTEAFNGKLQFDPTLPVDLDGRSFFDGDGVVLAVDGDVEVLSELSDSFSGQLNVGPNRTFAVTRPGTVFRNAPASEDQDGSGQFGRIDIQRGRLVAEAFEQASQMQVLGGGVSTIDADNVRFEAGSGTEIVDPAGELHLTGASQVEAGANIFGAGSLVNRLGGSLTLEHNSIVEVPVRNAGSLHIGNSPGQTRLLDFAQAASGSLEIELAGLVAGTEYDQMLLSSVSGVATLDGTLVVSLLGGFAPNIGDVFEILRAPGGVLGTFASELLPSLDVGQQWNVVYDPTAVLLEVLEGFAADFDKDGDVDGEDFLIWQSAFGTTVGATHNDGDADLDGDVDGNDFLVWQSEFGSGGGSGAGMMHAGSVPEPSTALLILLAIASAVAPSRNRRVA